MKNLISIRVVGENTKEFVEMIDEKEVVKLQTSSSSFPFFPSFPQKSVYPLKYLLNLYNLE